MLAVLAAHVDEQNPLAGLKIGEWPEPVPPPGWTSVELRAAGLNHHDLWTLRGVGVAAEGLPVVLGAEGAGVDEEGNEVIVHAVVGDPAAGGGDETLDPAMGLLSSEYDGTFAERVVVPRRNLVPKPAALSFEEAACLPGAWLTAYRMLFERSGAEPGSTVLVQGAGGGVSTALITLGAAAGHRVWVTGRTEQRRARARELGAERTFAPGTRLPERVDVVLETVGAATWEHSARSVRPGGRIVVCGATTGARVPLDLSRLFYRQVSVVGSTLGTRDQLARLAGLVAGTGLRPLVDRVLPLTRAREGFAAMAAGRLFGKIVLGIRP
ncbi:zinc-binding dehydrogenase [Amycolatopsis ultiminotia]|uniref:Zinc-binding dehydrogenase n=1 Tax=Amycolatopsis ultiminotia TaxID=543629 RepID=A0ABP6XJ67_9PSEU